MKIRSIFCSSLISVSLVSCSNSRIEPDRIKSPDGVHSIIVEQRSWGGALGGVQHTMYIDNGMKREKIFSGKSRRDYEIIWASENMVIIEYCNGYISDFEPKYEKETGSELISIQVIFHSGFSYLETDLCAKQ